MDLHLTEPQRRTLDELIGTGPRPEFPLDLSRRLRGRIEDAVRELDLRDQLWLGKEKLNDHARCEGKFLSQVLGESPPFEHSPRSAAGILLHKAIEVEVGSREPLDPHAIAARAAERLTEREERFSEYWRDLDRAQQDEHLMEVVRGVTLFQATFPPLREMRHELAPVCELGVKAELLEGALVLSGRIDLVLGAPDRLEPGRATRLAIDLKTGGAYPEYPEDMRFYALLLTLRFGVPPYRAASLFLDSGEWQAEDVVEDTLQHAADRVIDAARAAASLTGGRDPSLRPGPYCAWCPRAERCPAFAAAAGVTG
ncbi:MAG: PD-(D/E)XK nuclease family protein [Actinobacteria bacterium]|nr:PD-(D/E)XK nuclease family protein [Actinomycetota bacterium]